MQGVGCLACHLREGSLLARQKSQASPHQTNIDPRFGEPAFCGGCHDFNFPLLGDDGRQERPTTLPMQETYRQFVSSGYAKTTECIDCHDGHRFAGATDPSMIKDALEISGCVQEDKMFLSLKNIGAAHNIPTGGIDRHLWMRVWRSSAPEGIHKARIGRTFTPEEGGGKSVTSDNTIPARGERWFVLKSAALRGEKTEPIKVTIEYVAGPEKDTSITDISWDVLETTVNESALPICEAEHRATPMKQPRQPKSRKRINNSSL
jgi:hypothetical protein